MDLAKAHALIARLEAGGGFVLYSGQFVDEHAPGLIAMVEGLSASCGRSKAHAHRLSFVLVEAYQNIIRHRALLTGRHGRSLLMLRVGRNADLVTSMDPVHEADAERMERALLEITGSDLAQLKQRFLARLRDGTRTIRGGAGLGLIEMARRSGGGLQHDWLPADPGHRMLLLQAVMGGARDAALTVQEAQQLHGLSDELEALLVFSCGISPGADSAALRIMERESGSDARMARISHAAAEWLSQEAAASPSALMLAGTGAEGRLVLAVKGDEKRLAALHERIKQASALGRAERERLHRETLLGRSPDSGTSVALLELTRNATGTPHSVLLDEGSFSWLLWSVPLLG